MNVGVFDMGGSNWTGGLTYLRNLGCAVRTTIPERLKLFLIRPTGPARGREDWVSSYFDGMIEVSPFGGTRRPLLEVLRKSISILAGGDIINARRFERAIAPYGVDVLFGNGLTNRFNLPSVGWFPDFQHVDLPEFFTKTDIAIRNLSVRRMAQNCTLMVFSSQHAKKKFIHLHPEHATKARVLNFVAHLPDHARTGSPESALKKYGIPTKFIYLPNQLWKHKNHLTAFRAVKMLKDRGERVNLVCSGNPNDSRHPDYKESLFKYLQENGLCDSVFMLGLVEFDDVYALIRQSCCVLNPSLYEGWSTTVEETKTMGKPMILSDLEVHREQNPPETCFFEPKNAEALADAMLTVWTRHGAGPSESMERAAERNYRNRSKEFAETFADICREAKGRI